MTKIAAVQAAPVFLDREATVDLVCARIAEAGTAGAKLVVFPESFVPGYPDWVWRTKPWEATAVALHTRLIDQAIVVGSPASATLGEIAGRLGVWLVIGVDERDER